MRKIFQLQIVIISLLMILSADAANAQLFKQNYEWKYKNKEYSMNLILNTRTYNYYKKSDKRLLYTKEITFGKFFDIKENDNLIKMITKQLRVLARKNKIPNDEMPDFAAAFVQYIDYDSVKANKILNEKWSADTDIYFHYETVYLKKGVCTDKSILLVSILRNLGYGTALLLMDSAEHAAAAIYCEKSKSIKGSGYCYIESTAPLPIGLIPPQIKEEEIEILQKTTGNLYKFK